MAVYVDNMRMKAKVGNMRPAVWSHLMADTPEELHDFAVNKLGLRRAWAQHEDDICMLHYDVTDSVRTKAIKLGAVQITWREAGMRVIRCRKEQAAARSRTRSRWQHRKGV